MLIKVPSAESDHKMSHLDGEDHDRCPDCGKDVDPKHRLKGGRVIYSDDPRKGGCGAAWSRTPKAAVAEDASRGIKSKNPTGSAAVNRTTFMPSEAYRSRYEEVFGHA